MRSIIHNHIKANINYGNGELVCRPSIAFKLFSLRLKRHENSNQVGFRQVNMDFDFIEFEKIFKKLFKRISSILSLWIDESLFSRTFRVDEDACGALGQNVVLVDQLEWLKRV